MIRNSQTGFTLLEILVVLVILSMLLGLGVGAFSKVGAGPNLAVDRIREVIRSTRAHARRESAPSAVLIDAERNRIAGMGWKQVGCWHFEDVNEGRYSTGFPEDVFLGPARLDPNGVIGRCIALAVAPGQRPEVFIPSAPSLDSVDGISVELYLFLERAGAGIVLSKGTAYHLEIDEEGRLKAGLTLHRDAGGPKGTKTVLGSTGYSVPVGRWVKVGFQFNGYAFYLMAEGFMQNSEIFPERRRMARHAGSIVQIGIPGPIGGGLQVRIDELKMAAAVLGEETGFHEKIDLIEPSFSLHFDARGGLDNHFHTKPVSIGFTYAGSDPHTVTLDLLGEVR